MTTKQVLELSCVFLGKEDLLTCSYLNVGGEQASVSQQKELDMLLRCLNLICSEISTDYYSIKATKSIELTNNEIALNSIDENIYEIVSITDENDRKLNFKCYGDKLYCDKTNVQVNYTKYASSCEFNGNVESFNNKIPIRTLAYGVAMEYCFISSLFEDAEIWETRYKNSLLAISNTKREKVMPKRRWL